MRHGYRLAALTALAGVVLAACSDGRPNDLDTYYEQAPTTAPSKPATPPNAAPRTAPPPPTVSAEALRAVLLRDADVASEGVRGAPRAPTPTGCLATMAAQHAAVRPAPVGKSAAWRYPSGSQLRQFVRAMPVPGAAMSVRDVPCEAPILPLSAPPGVEAHTAWCEPEATGGATCTVLLARGQFRSALQISAQDPTRAKEAAARLAPVAARALARPR